MWARFTVLSDTPIASAIEGCAIPLSRSNTIWIRWRCSGCPFQRNAVFKRRIWPLVHLTICSSESDGQSESHPNARMQFTPLFGALLPQTFRFNQLWKRYYTIPMEIGLYPTPGVDNIRSTSFYGLTFVRVTFKYGIDYFFAYTQANLSLQQNVSLPGGQIPQIQQSSLVGEVYRYQVVGPPNFGLTNLRTVQDWIAIRRLFTVPGVVQVNSWGGTTKQFNVEVDLHKLDAYNVTIPQVISNLGTANINVGGREITVGQQSVNIRGIGLFDDGGDTDLTQGWKVTDIENVVLTSVNGVPVQVKDVAKVSVGYVPRLGIAGKDRDDDVALSIVVMGRTFHTNDVVPRIQAEIERINSDGTLPPGVKLVPYYDRASLVAVTTHTVLHNLVFGCLLVF